MSETQTDQADSLDYAGKILLAYTRGAPMDNIRPDRAPTVVMASALLAIAAELRAINERLALLCETGIDLNVDSIAVLRVVNPE